MHGYYQYPTIHRDLIVFSCEEDLWSVSSEGGRARRLTSGGVVGRPLLSPDGMTIAFTSQVDGSREVYVMSRDGGESTRLTFTGGNVEVLAWLPNSSAVIFSTDAYSPFPQESLVYSVALHTKEISKLPVGAATAISFSGDGASVLCRNMRDLATWKRNRGGMTGQIWCKRDDTESWNRLTLQGNSAHPFILDNRIYFVSDSEGKGSLYSCTFDGKELRKEASHDEYYIRFPSSDGQRVVYQAGGDIYLFHPLRRADSTRVEIDHRSPRNGTKPRFLDASRWLEEYDVNNAGDRALIVSRGKVFVFCPSGGSVLQLGAREGVRYQYAQFLHDDVSVIMVSDESSTPALEVYDGETGELQKHLDLDLGRPLGVKANPQNRKVAVKNHRGDLFIVDLDKETSEQVAHAQFTLFRGWDWSPDGRWLAYSAHRTSSLARIALYDTDTKLSHWVTGEDSFDLSPSFDPEGRYLYFLSSIDDEPVYDATTESSIGFPLGHRLFAVTLRPGTPSPLTREAWGNNDKSGSSFSIDPVGIERRIVAIPAPVKRYWGVEALPEGKLILLSYPPDDSFDGSIDALQVSTGQSEELFKQAPSFSVSRSHTHVLYKVGEALHFGRDTPSALDLARVKLRVEPPAEWRQIFREAWQRQRDYFWSEDMAGVDWKGMFERYEPLLDRIATRSELSDLLKELLGELANAHAKEEGGDYNRSFDSSQGRLGADLRYDSKTDSYLVERIIRGDPWNPNASSPLEQWDVNEGDRITAIDGCRTTAAVSPSLLLVNKAHTEVEIGMVSKVSAEARKIVVRPMGDERMLRYRAWVEANRAKVHEYSSARVGYLHLPNMCAWGYKEFRRYYPNEVGYEGLIVDVRYNRGGHTSYLILEKLARRQRGFDIGRWTGKRAYPLLSPGTLVALTNQFCGSDGELFAHGFKQLKLGRVIGTRTWGGVVGGCRLDPFVDGGRVMPPERASWFEDVGYGLENYGAEPDIEVQISPEEAGRGEDPQLMRAIEEALALCEARKAGSRLGGPDMKPYPS